MKSAVKFFEKEIWPGLKRVWKRRFFGDV